VARPFYHRNADIIPAKSDHICVDGFIKCNGLAGCGNAYSVRQALSEPTKPKTVLVPSKVTIPVPSPAVVAMPCALLSEQTAQPARYNGYSEYV